MILMRLRLAALSLALLGSGCVTHAAQSGSAYLSEDQVINLMQQPRQWDGRTVTIRIFPYDNGFATSYVVCFEQCDQAFAERSPFIILTSQGRFSGYRGDRPVVVTARYSSACFYDANVICADTRFGRFREIPSP
jgi:hypothetical protein